jgi:hypothetical protein
MATVLTTLTSLVTTGANVARNRTHPWDDAVTDALNIVMGEDKRMPDSSINILDFELDLTVEIHTKNATLETQINKIKAEIIVALMANYTMGLSYVIQILERGFLAPELSGAAEKPTALCKGNFTIHYQRSWTTPEA